jgi:hypothetical protein
MQLARLLAGLLLAAIFVAIQLHSEQLTTWATVPEGSGVNVKREVLGRLTVVTDTLGKVKPGAKVHLLSMLGAARNRIDLFLAEADFSRQTIEGADQWRDLLIGETVLVNSVDEYRRNNGASSEIIAAGCRLTSLKEGIDKPHQIGDVFLEPCNGPYRTTGISHVADVAIVVWADEDGRPRCKKKQARDRSVLAENFNTPDPEYASCISGWTAYALSDLFGQRPEAEDSRTIVIPSIATGVGEVPPEAFYQAVRKTVEEMLSSPEASENLPDRLILLLWRNWKADEWTNHQIAIANLVSELHNRWRAKAAKFQQVGALASILGILVGLIAVVLVTALSSVAVPRRLRDMDEKQLAITLVGWGLAALGLITVLQSLLGSFLRNSAFTSLLLGIIAVLLAVMVQRAKDSFGDVSKIVTPNTPMETDAEIGRGSTA